MYQKTFNIAEDGDCTKYSVLSLGYSDSTWTNGFLDSVLEDEVNKFAVLTYDK
jgi:hypothetical protein